VILRIIYYTVGVKQMPTAALFCLHCTNQTSRGLKVSCTAGKMKKEYVVNNMQQSRISMQLMIL